MITLSNLHYRDVLPFLILLMAVFLSPLPWPLGAFHIVSPKLSAILIYYFILIRPQAVPLILIFLLGIISDFLLATPIGFNAIGFLLLGWLSHRWSPHVQKMGFVAKWGLFFPILALSIMLEMVLYYGFFGYINWVDQGFRLLTSWAIFPLVVFLLKFFMEEKSTPNHRIKSNR